MRTSNIYILPVIAIGLCLLYLSFGNRKYNSIGSCISNFVVAKPSDHQDVNIFRASLESNELNLAAMKQSCVPFKTPGTMSKICVYPEEEDFHVSKDLIHGGMWEADFVQLVSGILARNPGMSLLDLGCNIGTFTVYVANMGRRVVAVDPNKMNLMLLSRSLDVNNLQQNVTLVWNAISNVRENVILDRKTPKNKGSYQVEPVKDSSDANIIKTVYLDDLACLFGKESILIKMDIEGSEMKGLAEGRQFFESKNVKYLLMEFFMHRESPSGKQIVDFLSERGYNAFVPNATTNIPLKIAEYRKWPNNVLWIKQ